MWLQSYAVLVPAGLYKPIWEYDAKTLWQDPSAHLVYGMTTATTFSHVSDLGMQPRLAQAVGRIGLQHLREP